MNLYYGMAQYSHVAPKESVAAPASALNFLVRLPMAFTFGFCTLKYPPRGANYGISISRTLSQNSVTVAIICVVFCAFLVGYVRLLRKRTPETLLLTGAILLPVSILVMMQEVGFSLLNVRHCAGVLGPFCVLLSGVMINIWRSWWGKLGVALYGYLIAVSLVHFYFQPEVYSRRSNYSALNAFLLEELQEDDHLLTYHWSVGIKPNYLTAAATANTYVDLYRDRPQDLSMTEFIESIDANCTGRIYLVDSGAARRRADPQDRVVSFLEMHRDSATRRYGRNLSLYVFSERPE